jgi:hypothetical protein
VSTVQEISEAIEHLDVRGQMQLLHDLPARLKIQPDYIAWLKAAEPAFEFWNNRLRRALAKATLFWCLFRSPI